MGFIDLAKVYEIRRTPGVCEFELLTETRIYILQVQKIQTFSFSFSWISWILFFPLSFLEIYLSECRLKQNQI